MWKFDFRRPRNEIRPAAGVEWGSMKSGETWTSNGAHTQVITTDLHYFVDAQVGRTIQRVLRKAARWKRDCCGERTGKKACESYGCASLDELLQPLRDLRITGKRKARRGA